MFMSDAEFDTYAPSHVSIGMEYTLVTYHVVVIENWNKITIERKYMSPISHKKRRMTLSFNKTYQ